MDSPVHKQGVHVCDRDEVRIIGFRWYSEIYLVPLIGLIALVAIFVPFYVEKIIEANAEIFVVLLMPWVIFVVYYLLSKLINRTLIKLFPDRLHIIHGPLPFKRPLTVPYSHLNELKVAESIYAGKSRRSYYKVCYTFENIQRNLVSDIDHYDQAVFIVNKINEYYIKMKH